MIVWWSGAGVHVEPHSHANEQIVSMLKGKMEFRFGSEQRVCGLGDVVVIPGGAEHEAWFREESEAIDFFAPPRNDFLSAANPPTHDGASRPNIASSELRALVLPHSQCGDKRYQVQQGCASSCDRLRSADASKFH